MSPTEDSEAQHGTVSILGCGWLGLPLAQHLVGQGFRVKGSTTQCDRFDDLESVGVTPYLVILDPDLSCGQETEFFQTDVLVVAIPPGRRREDVETFHPRQIQSLADHIATNRVPFLLFVSSTSVYPERHGTVREEDAGDPPTPSGRALLEAERILTANPHFQTTIVRFGGLIGADRNPARFLAGRKHVPNPEAPVNLIHRDDCIAILSFLIQRDIRGEVFNACCDAHPTKRDFYIREAGKLGFMPPTFAPDTGRGGKIVNSDKIKRILNYEFKFPDPSQAFAPPNLEPATGKIAASLPELKSIPPLYPLPGTRPSDTKRLRKNQ